MGIGSFFRKSRTRFNPGVLYADMHSHLIPGIDDGAPTLEASLTMLRQFSEMGYRRIITTPHVMADHYRNTTAIIRSGEEKVIEAIQQEGLNIAFSASAEYYLDQDFIERIKKKDLLSFGANYILFELPFFSAPDFLPNVIFDLQLAGFKPVLAHPERYSYWHRQPEKYQELSEKGVYLQANLLSFAGAYGPEVKKAAEALVKSKLISFAGSDCHNPGHLEQILTLNSASLDRLIESDSLLNRTL